MFLQTKGKVVGHLIVGSNLAAAFEDMHDLERKQAASELFRDSIEEIVGPSFTDANRANNGQFVFLRVTSLSYAASPSRSSSCGRSPTLPSSRGLLHLAPCFDS